MARTIRNAKIDTRSARAKLPLNKSGYWTAISPGCAIGYRKGTKGGAWVAKFVRDDVRRETTLGPADDALEADGTLTLSYGQAQEQARNWFAEQARSMAGEGAPLLSYTVRECLADYVTELRRKGAKSVKDIQTRIDALILPVLGDLEITKLTAKLIQGWQADLAQSPPRLRTRPGETQKYGQHSDDPEQTRRRRATANRMLTILKAALNHAFAHGKVASDSAWRRVRPFREADAARIRYITTDECRWLIDGADAEFRPLVQAALATGCRYGELIALRAADFDEQAGSLLIRASKSGKSRHVALRADGVELFRQLSRGKQAKGLLFTHTDGRAWRKSHQARPLIAASQRVGIEPPVNFHALRHTYASHLAMAGVPMFVIAKNLGHADTRMTEKHYAHLSPSQVATAIRAANMDLAVFHAADGTGVSG